MRKIYSEDGLIYVKRTGDKYFFYNPDTRMKLHLYKIDIETFCKFNSDNWCGLCSGKSYSNYITNREFESIKIYLKLKNKKLTKLSSMIKAGENMKDVINIFKLDELIEYVERNNLWKNL